MAHDPEHAYVGRGGLKLRHALDSFGIDPRGMRCADFGCNIGGFTDCLLQAGAVFVYAIDTGYGALAWKLRQDPRVGVMERTNALHATPPEPSERVNLVVIDMGWTPQRLCIPAAVKWLAPGGRIVSLIKPHYEVSKAEAAELLDRGVLAPDRAEAIASRTLESLSSQGICVMGSVRSPLEGGAGKGNARGNAEWLALLAPGS